jgi:upstream activation factor subunit UAF30
MPKTKSTKIKSRSRSTKSKSKSRSKKEEEVKEEVPKEEVSDIEAANVVKVKKKRHVPTKETVLEEFEELIQFIDNEVSTLRENSSKNCGIKYLRSVGKRIKTVRGHASRVMKAKKAAPKRNNTNSGFLKPVKVSKEICKFTGWDQEDLKSRVEVTKYLCKYIKDNDLQNPEDRRQILADAKLTKLLQYDKETATAPLTYYALQTYLKPHFTKAPKEEKI